VKDDGFDELLRDLTLLGVRVWIERDQIKYRAPRGIIDDALIARMQHFSSRLRTSFSQAEDDADCLVRMTSGRSGKVLFCPHAVDGSALVYWRFAERLGESRTIYAFENRRLIVEGRPITDLAEMAARYVERMRIAQPRGPYHLFGFSSGGLIAIEMAHRLSTLGESVSLLALGDTRLTFAQGAPRKGSASRFHWVVFAGIFLSGRAQQLVLSKMQTEDAFWTLPVPARLRVLLALEEIDDASISRRVDELERSLNAFLTYVECYNDYKPRPYHGPITYFRVVGCQPPPENWAGSLAAGQWETINIPGEDHMQILHPPGVDRVAESIRRLTSD
jgi:thioesterase domain-containing protein